MVFPRLRLEKTTLVLYLVDSPSHAMQLCPKTRALFTQPTPDFHMGAGQYNSIYPSPVDMQTSIYSRWLKHVILLWTNGYTSHQATKQEAGKENRPGSADAIGFSQKGRAYMPSLIDNYCRRKLSFGYVCLGIFMFRTGLVREVGIQWGGD